MVPDPDVRPAWRRPSPTSTTCRSARSTTRPRGTPEYAPPASRPGRDPDSLVYSVAQSLLLGRDEADLAGKIEQVGLKRSGDRDAGLVGTPDQVADKIGRFAEVGATRVYLQLQDLHDIDQLSVVAEQAR